MTEDRNLLELAAMYHRLAANCTAPDVVDKFSTLANEYQAAASDRLNGSRTIVIGGAKPFLRWRKAVSAKYGT